jgi:2-polyprenyl-3-methyl-5-hydroxy-6-metoxy-1,4-benzoquinol methylase
MEAILQDLNIDAVEIHKPYIEKYKIERYYKNVFVGNILEFNYDDYDYIIIGDVLEHIHVKAAQKLIKDITFKRH